MSVGLVDTVKRNHIGVGFKFVDPANFHPPHSLRISEECVVEVNTENRNFEKLFFERCVARSLSICSTCRGEENLLGSFYIGMKWPILALSGLRATRRLTVIRHHFL